MLRIRRNAVKANAARPGAIQLIEGDLPLGSVRSCCFRHPRSVGVLRIHTPALGQEEPQRNQHGHIARGRRNPDQNLVVGSPAQFPAVLQSHPHGVALLDERLVSPMMSTAPMPPTISWAHSRRYCQMLWIGGDDQAAFFRSDGSCRSTCTPSLNFTPARTRGSNALPSSFRQR